MHFNEDLEEIATWRQNDLLAIQNGDSRLFGAKIDLETCNAANIIEETMYTGCRECRRAVLHDITVYSKTGFISQLRSSQYNGSLTHYKNRDFLESINFS